MENSDLIKQYIASLDGAVGALEPEVSELTSKSFEDRLNMTSDPMEQMTVANGYAYVLTSLCFAYLKSQGVNTNTHPIMGDLDRVKSYMARAKLVAEGKDEVKVDTSAAKRFINSVLGSTSPAISSENFKPKHTKFEDKATTEKTSGDDLRNKLKEKLNKEKKKSRTTEGKVVKPKK